MVFNVIIADDEYFIRQRIKKIIPWNDLDLHLIGEAENGLEVIDLLQNSSVDLILLDIKMPQMTGIQVAKYVLEHFPSTRIIFLSGYNDFEYARSAMKFNVVDYLLKPVDPLILKTTLQDCIKKIIQTRIQSIQIQKYYHYEKCTELSKVLNGVLNLDNLFSKYPELKEVAFSFYLGVFIFEETIDTITTLVTKFRLLGWDCEYFKELDYTYTLQFFSKTKPDMAEFTTILMEFVSGQEVYVFLTIGKLFSLSENWLPYYKRVHYYLNQRYFSSDSTVYIEPQVSPYKKISNNLSSIRQEILLLLNSQDIDGFKIYIHSLFKDIEDNHNIDYLQLVVTETFITYSIHYHHLVNFSHNITEFATMLIDEQYQLHELENTIISYGLQCITENDIIPSNIALSKNISNYIDKHYADSTLTVAVLADFFQLNASYMGSVFKKVRGQSILQYITNVRMEASKKLLAANQYRVSDIAEMIGYSDAFYYSKRFKKMYGYSPRDYILLCQSETSRSKN